MSEKQSSSSSSSVNGGSTQSKPSPLSLFPSPRLFRSFSSKGFSDHESSMSPTSILETKHLCSLGALSISDRQPKKASFENGGSEPTGLGILDALAGDDKLKESSDAPPRRRMIVFGSQLKVQIPTPMELPTSPIEFGVKNKDSKLALFSPALRSSLGTEAPARETFSPRSISVSEMERSEDYTCVISHGPNPKTTHIFDNCIVESCGDEFTATRKTAGAFDNLTASRRGPQPVRLTSPSTKSSRPVDPGLSELRTFVWFSELWIKNR